MDQRKNTVLVQLANSIAPKLAQFIFIDHLKATIDEGLLLTFLLNGYFTIHEKVELFDFFNKGVCLRASIFKIFAELQNRVGVLARLAVFKQRQSFVKFANRTGCWVKAQ